MEKKVYKRPVTEVTAIETAHLMDMSTPTEAGVYGQQNAARRRTEVF